MKWLFVYFLMTLVLLPMKVAAEVNEKINEQRAKFNYQMFCQGCHTGDGSGHKDVPTLKGFMGHFLNSQEGREYLVRVPGSANSALNNEQLAEVLNWMLVNFAEQSAPNDWQAFEVDEVTEYRKAPLFEVINYRKQLVQSLDIERTDKNTEQAIK